jgi:hypothetical protein
VKRASVLAAVAVVAGCKTASIYTKGPPRRVQIEKQVGEPSILADGRRDDDGGVTIRVLELREVRVTRTTQHGALELRLEHPGHPAFELIEVPIGAFLTALMPISLVWDFTAMAGTKRDVKQGSLRPVLIFLNPAQAAFAMKPRMYVAREVTFDGGTQIRQYNVRLPVGERALRYRVLDAGRDVLASGDVSTDQFGMLRIPAVPAQAVGVELVGDHVQVIAPLDPER